MKKNTPEFTYIIDLSEPRNQDNFFTLEATQEEAGILADRFGIISLSNLQAQIFIKNSYGIYRVSGTIVCDIEQNDIVTLEPFISHKIGRAHV